MYYSVMIYFDWRVVVRMRVLYVHVDVRHFELNDKWISLDQVIHNSYVSIIWSLYTQKNILLLDRC